MDIHALYYNPFRDLIANSVITASRDSAITYSVFAKVDFR